MFSFVSKWLSRQTQSGKPERRSAPPRCRLLVERLEDRTVPSTLTVTSSGDSLVSGDGTLRGEIAVAVNGDQIVFDPSLSGSTIHLIYGELLISKDLNIQGLGAGNLAVSGEHNFRVFEIAAGATD